MDDIENAVLQAWNELPEAAQKTRLAILAQRRAAGIRPRPIRAWCLCLRASDTRISDYYSIVEPDDYHVEGGSHTVTIDAREVRRFCKPVIVDWPGMDWVRAACLLGRHPEGLRPFIKRGALEVRYRYARSMGKRGRPVPEVWSLSPLDSSANNARGADEHWGTMWQHLWERVPDDLVVKVRRKPNVRAYPLRDGRAQMRRRGWTFSCPRCGRSTARIFYPIKPVTLPDVFGLVPPVKAKVERREDDPFTLPMPGAPVGTKAGARVSAEVVTVVEAASDIELDAAAPFACDRCHRMIRVSLADRNGWNILVQSITAGLLRGGEVKKPESLRIIRKRRYTRHTARRPSLRRAQVLDGLAAGLKYRQIAVNLKVKYSVVHSHVKKLYRQFGVHSREELLAKLRPRPWPAGTAARVRGTRVSLDFRAVSLGSGVGERLPLRVAE